MTDTTANIVNAQPTYPPTKSVAQLDEDGLFIGMTTADLSPLEADKGVYLLPHNAVDTAAPERQQDKVAKWQDGTWLYLTDLRGRTAYHTATGKAVIIDGVGELDEQLTLLKPEPHSTWNGTAWTIAPEKQAELKAQHQEQIWEQIKQKRHHHTHSGVYLSSVGKWFHTDESSRTQYLALQILPQLPPDLQWKTMDNSFVPLTKPLLTELAMTILTNEQANFANAERHRMAMLQADNPLDYDFSTGWSAIFDSQAIQGTDHD